MTGRSHAGPPALSSVTVVGAGLIGTSIALALRRRGVDVAISDLDAEVAARAQALGAGRSVTAGYRAEHAVICVPPAQTAYELLRAQSLGLAHTFSDVASYKTSVLAEAKTLGCDMTSIIGGHPFAGRERGGPDNGDAELFTDRPWVLTPTAETSAEALLAARKLAETCGAVAVVVSPEGHDAAAARLSHLPQLLASALAAAAGDLDERSVSLAGQGFRDLTRIAESPASLWREIIAGNAREVAAAMQDLLQELHPVLAAVEAEAARADVSAQGHGTTAETIRAEVTRLIQAGNAGRARLPGKRGRPASNAATVIVAVSDKAGELARLLGLAASVGVNVEDVHVQHGAAASRGLVDLDVARADVPVLVSALRTDGWRCWAPESDADAAADPLSP